MPTDPDGSRPAPDHFLAGSLSDPALIDLIALLVDQEPGHQIPSERELSLELGVSRTALGVAAVVGLLLALLVEARVITGTRAPYVEPVTRREGPRPG